MDDTPDTAPAPPVDLPRSYRCEDSPSKPLLKFPAHAFAIYQLLAEDEFAGRVHNVGRASDWVILSAGLSEVVIETNGLSSDDAYCSNIYEEGRGPAASAVATPMTRLLFLWGAVEAMMETAIRGSGRKESPTKRMCRLVDSGPALLHQDCASRNLLKFLGDANDERFRNDLLKVEAFDSGLVGKATFAAYQVRNALAHGAMGWPDDDSEPSGPTVRVAEAAARVMLFAVQQLAHVLAPLTASMLVWKEDSSAPTSELIREQIRTAHVLPLP